MRHHRGTHRSRLPLILGPAVVSLSAIACGGETTTLEDAGARDALFDGPGDGAVCRKYTVPGDVSSFSPAYVKPAPPSKACTSAQIDEGIASCFGPKASVSVCASFKSGAGTCFACLTAVGGPFQVSSSGTLRNRGGCVELLDGAGGPTSCGGRVQALDQCNFAACDAEKTVDECNDATTTGLSDPGCPARASSTVCAAYARALNGCTAAFPQCFGSDTQLGQASCATP